MVLVYQAYGREDIIRQSLFSVASLLSVVKNESPLKIWVYTDQPKLVDDFFKNTNADRVQTHSITKEQIQNWRGPNSFVHRVKIKILQDAAQKFQGSLFYVDGDTYFLSDPTELFLNVNDQTSLMHVSENRIIDGKDPLSRKIARFLKRKHFLSRGQKIKIPLDLMIWNAGAIGVSEKNKKLLDEVLDLTDQTYSQYQKHVMEQLAFSYFLQKDTKVISADHVICHFWHQKEDYQLQIDQYLLTNKTIAEAVSNYPRFIHPVKKAPVVRRTAMQRFLRSLGLMQ